MRMARVYVLCMVLSAGYAAGVVAFVIGARQLAPVEPDLTLCPLCERPVRPVKEWPLHPSS